MDVPVMYIIIDILESVKTCLTVKYAIYNAYYLYNVFIGYLLNIFQWWN